MLQDPLVLPDQLDLEELLEQLVHKDLRDLLELPLLWQDQLDHLDLRVPQVPLELEVQLEQMDQMEDLVLLDRRVLLEPQALMDQMEDLDLLELVYLLRRSQEVD